MGSLKQRITEFIIELFERENVQVIIANKTLQGALVTGACSVVGFLLAGRTGFLTGVAVGTGLASEISGSIVFPAASLMVNVLSTSVKDSLIEGILKLLAGAQNIYLMLSQPEFQEKALKFLKEAIRKLDYVLA